MVLLNVTARKTVRLLALPLIGLLLAACGGGDDAADAGADAAEFEARKATMLAEMQQHFDTEE